MTQIKLHHEARRRRSRLSEAKARLGAGERLLARAADVSDPAQVRAFVEEATSALGPVHVLVNNAGIAYFGPFAKESNASISAVVDVNLKASCTWPARCCPR